MDKLHFCIIDGSEIFAAGLQHILASAYGDAASFTVILDRDELTVPGDAMVILVGNALRDQMSFEEILEYLKSFRLNKPVLLIPEMITSRSAKNLYASRLTDGIVTRDCARDELITAIEKVMDGEVYIGKGVSLFRSNEQTVIATKKDNPFYLVQKLTEQEKKVMEYVIGGKSSNDISQLMFRSIHTIKTHRKNLLQKLGVSNTIELIAYLDSIGYNK